MQLENVLVIDEARPEYTLDPVSPRPLLNLAVGFLVSSVFAVGFAVLRELLDKTLKTEEEMEEKFAVPVLGVIPQIKRRNV
jgi:capsular polysaccharide biosynthesis protein